MSNNEQCVRQSGAFLDDYTETEMESEKENDVETGEDRGRCWEIEVRLNFKKKECKEIGSEREIF